jgi:hypothetical protein
MSTAAWLSGFVAGAHASRRGEITARLVQFWKDREGYIIEPGGTIMRRWSLEEWLLYCDHVRQLCTGHNRLGNEW